MDTHEPCIHVGCPSSLRRRRRAHFPVSSPSAAVKPNHGPRGGGEQGALLHRTRGTPSRQVETRHRFRRRSCARHHPSARDTSNPLPCRLRGLCSQSSYLRHSPSVRGFKYLTDHGQAPGTTPVPTHLPRLGVTFQEHVTSLEGCIPRALHSTFQAPARTQSPKTVALSSLSGGRTQKLLPYPSVQALRRSAPSHVLVTSKGLRPSHG